MSFKVGDKVVIKDTPDHRKDGVYSEYIGVVGQITSHTDFPDEQFVDITYAIDFPLRGVSATRLETAPVAEVKTQFEVGDKIIMRDDAENRAGGYREDVGKIGTIVYIQRGSLSSLLDHDMLTVEFETGKATFAFAYRFDLVKEEPTTAKTAEKPDNWVVYSGQRIIGPFPSCAAAMAYAFDNGNLPFQKITGPEDV